MARTYSFADCGCSGLAGSPAPCNPVTATDSCADCAAAGPPTCGIQCQSNGSIDVAACGPFYPGVTIGAGTQCNASNANCLGNPQGEPGMVTQTAQYRFNCTGLTVGQWYRIDFTFLGSPTQYYFLATAASESTPYDSIPFPPFPGQNEVSGCTICAVPAQFSPCP